MEQPSFRATLIIYVAFNFLSSSAILETVKWETFPLFHTYLFFLFYVVSQKGASLANSTLFCALEPQENWHTCFSLCNNAPINHPWLYSTKKLQEENSIWKVFILKRQVNLDTNIINHRLKSDCKTRSLITWLPWSFPFGRFYLPSSLCCLPSLEYQCLLSLYPFYLGSVISSFLRVGAWWTSWVAIKMLQVGQEARC